MKKPLLLGLGLAVLLVALAVALPSLRAQLTAPAQTVTAPPPSEAPIGATSADTPPTTTPHATATAPSPDPSPAEPPAGPSAANPGTTGPTAAASPTTPSGSLPALKPVGRKSLDSQIRQVVDSMDRNGRPPSGVVQGGRRGAKRGVFENAERKLPVKPSGYYRESDVWPPKRTGRGAERLVFGRQGEVYYSADHYQSFARLR